jgi:hypothetical protein
MLRLGVDEEETPAKARSVLFDQVQKLGAALASHEISLSFTFALALAKISVTAASTVCWLGFVFSAIVLPQHTGQPLARQRLNLTSFLAPHSLHSTTLTAIP